jgi:membrane-associated phospholipid phosphatase
MANLFLHTSDVFVSKDLFFSGHVAALVLLMLLVVDKYAKAWIFLCTIMVGIMIMWQHVHYSSDVIFAPLASYIAYKFVLYIHRETQYGLETSNSNF